MKPPHAVGRKHSAETKAKMSAWQIGKRLSEETKVRIAAKAIGRVATQASRDANRQGQLGRRHTDEVLARMRAAKARKSKPVICVQTGEQFASLSYAAKELGVTPTQIRGCLQGKARAAKGYTFQVPA